MIPQAFVQDLLARVDIIDVIERYIPLKKGGANYFACCPFHGEKTASFSVSPAKQFYHCFGCGAHGSAVGFMMEYGGLSFVDAIKELAAQVGMQVPEENVSARQDQLSRTPLYDAMETAAAFYRDQLKQPVAIEYLKSRGLNGKTCTRLGIGFAPPGWQPLSNIFKDYQSQTLAEAGLVIDNEQGRRYDRFRNRIMFPIHDRRGRVIAFGGRVIGPDEPKYLNSPETPLFEKGRELYGLHLARNSIRESGFALVVEGYMDVAALAQFRIENTVAALGTATTPAHINTLLRLTDRIVFCFDGDDAGRHAAWRALENSLESLRDDARLEFMFLPAGHDPDTYVRAEGADGFRHAVGQALPLTRFMAKQLGERHPPDSGEGRAALLHEAQPLVKKIAAPMLRLQIAKELADLTHLTAAEAAQAFSLPSQPRSRRSASMPAGRSAPPPRGALRRKTPSTIETLLRLILQHPQWAARLPIDLLPDDSDEGRALIALVDLVSLGEPIPDGGLGALVERFRGTPHGRTFVRIAAEQMDEEFDESVVETLFEDMLRKLQANAIKDDIRHLLEKERQEGLSATERHRLAELLLQQRKPGALP